VQPIAARMKPYMDGVKEPALLNYYVLVWPCGGGTIGSSRTCPKQNHAPGSSSGASASNSSPVGRLNRSRRK